MTTEQQDKFIRIAEKRGYPDGITDSVRDQHLAFLDGLKDGYSDGKKDGWNEAIDNIERKLTGMMSGVSNDTYDKTIWLVIEEIQKLRK